MTVEQPKTPVITIEDIDGFYRENKISETCPMCGKDVWVLLTADGEEEVQHIAPQLFTPNNKPTGKAPRLIPLMCDNCGNVRFQHVRPITDWKRTNGQS